MDFKTLSAFELFTVVSANLGDSLSDREFHFPTLPLNTFENQHKESKLDCNISIKRPGSIPDACTDNRPANCSAG
jgi:hypothetical protein